MSKIIERIMELNEDGFNVVFESNNYEQETGRFAVRISRRYQHDDDLVQSRAEVTHEMIKGTVNIPIDTVVTMLINNLVKEVEKIEGRSSEIDIPAKMAIQDKLQKSILETSAYINHRNIFGKDKTV